MTRLRYDGLKAKVGAGGIDNVATTLPLDGPLTHSNGVAVPTFASPKVLPLVILDSSGNLSEIVWGTAYTSGASSITVARAQESTPTAVAHSAGAQILHGPLAADTDAFRQVLVYSGGAYPARPSGGICEYVGPTQPTDWLAHDTWIKAAP
jgi:hypothetical protein